MVSIRVGYFGATPKSPASSLRWDTLRVAHVGKDNGAMGGPREMADRLAKALYLGLIGIYSARHYTPAQASDDAYLELVRVVLNSMTKRSAAVPK